MNLFRLKKKMFVFDSESLIHRPSCMASWVFVWWEDGYFHHRSSPRIINGKVDIARLWCGAEQGAQGLWNELLLNFISSTSHLTILWSNSWIEVDLFCYSLLKKKRPIQFPDSWKTLSGTNSTRTGGGTAWNGSKFQFHEPKQYLGENATASVFRRRFDRWRWRPDLWGSWPWLGGFVV